MELVKPQAFLIGETRIVTEGLQAYLEAIGVPDWETDAPSDSEALAEVMGRLCYRSFAPGLNPNVTKVREGNAPYLGNIIGVRHGSVLEHPVVNLIFKDVSRVLTHELVRHRIGVGISQESLRFVRLDTLSAYMPMLIEENETMTTIFVRTFEQLEQIQRELAELSEIGKEGFDKKKKLTSAFRRLAPMGLATSIGWSANFRTLRFVIEQRTDPSAEEEIRYLFGQVYEIVSARYPNFFADYEVDIVDGLPHVHTPNRKV